MLPAFAWLLLSIILVSNFASSSTDVPTSPKTCSSKDNQSCSKMDYFNQPPFVAPSIFQQGKVVTIDDSDTGKKSTDLWSITGCCSKKPIGQMPQMSTEQSSNILNDALIGWGSGKGTWTQMSLAERIERVQTFITELQTKREEIIRVLMWEIGKNYPDAEAEFDRTIVFIQKTIEAIQEQGSEYNSKFVKIGSTNVFTRRNGFGIILCLGPYNYPLNETYATLIPALLMGNIVILKIPQTGGLAHLLTFDAFAKALPPNTIHFISGSGRKTLPPLMTSGKIDGLAFIGGTSAADKLIKQHPEPHRLKVFLQLEAKNMAILLNDLFDESSSDNGKDGGYTLDKAMDEVITGSLSYNGQRCTALKIIFVPKGQGELVAQKLSKRVEAMNKGLPWDIFDNDKKFSQITPLPNDSRISYMQTLMDDATSKGAKIMNLNGGTIMSAEENDGDETNYSKTHLMVPAVLYPVTSIMKIYTEEQFGPLVPVVEYESLDEVVSYGLEGIYGQQVAIFTHADKDGEASALVDNFSAVFGKININSQCGRSPDIVPFTARKSSGLGVMSIDYALKEFSIPTVVSFKDGKDSNIDETVSQIQKESNFMSTL
jgi:glyceraldehyde-3-phosphate dehydrogenase (NADP+)